MTLSFVVRPLGAFLTGAFLVVGLISQASAQAPAVRHYGTTAYMTGGVGREESRPMVRLAGRYNLRVTLAEGRGAYLPEVRLIVRDQQGRTHLALRNAGPLVFARVRPGKYSIAAEHGQRIFIQRVTVPSRGQRAVVVHWPVDIGHKTPAR